MMYKALGLVTLLLVCSVRAESCLWESVWRERTKTLVWTILTVYEPYQNPQCELIMMYVTVINAMFLWWLLVRGPNEPKVIGDIAVDDTGRNADPCTSRNCKWAKSSDGLVYVPYVIADHFSSRELQVIQRGLDSFAAVSCIRFIPRSSQRNYIHIQSLSGCYSYVGQIGFGQPLSLDRSGCVYHDIVQHELLHALGFNHEQTRSDRDDHIVVVWENIIEDMKYNFDKINTLNQNTPYDYNSVMQYFSTAFSKNGLPTMVPIPDNNVKLGEATEMSNNDVLRLQRLYQCCKYTPYTSVLH
ncbi:hypothetical protein NFI96_011107, partial [Prochilodus magdalenae]